MEWHIRDKLAIDFQKKVSKMEFYGHFEGFWGGFHANNHRKVVKIHQKNKNDH